MGSLGLTTTLVSRGPAAAVVLDDEQTAAVGEGAKRFPVLATVNGYSWRTTITRRRGEFLLGLSREVRNAAGVEAGDTVNVHIELDTAPREVDAVMRHVPKGKLITINEIRAALAKKHKVDVCCPITTGIFAWIAAHVRICHDISSRNAVSSEA